jgi:Skp family chaperone for outer membrane proteins
MKKLVMSMSLMVAVGARLQAADSKNVVDTKAKTTAPAPQQKIDVSLQKLIGFISSQKLIGDYWKVKELNEKLTADVNAAQKELLSMASELGKAAKEQQELNEKSNNPALNEEAKKKLKAEAESKFLALKQKENAINDFKTNSERRIMEMKQTEGDKITDIIKKTIEAVARAEEYTLIVDKDNPAILFSDGSSEITDKVLEKLNATQPKPAVAINPGTAAGGAATKK